MILELIEKLRLEKITEINDRELLGKDTEEESAELKQLNWLVSIKDDVLKNGTKCSDIIQNNIITVGYGKNFNFDMILHYFFLGNELGISELNHIKNEHGFELD